MPTRSYNQFYPWIKEDDFLTVWSSIIEWNNVTWLRDGYGLTLWPKMNKQLLTNTAPRTIFWREIENALENMAVWCDGWEIYKLTSTDNTPIYTLTTWWDILNWALLLKGSVFMYFASKNPWTSTFANLMQVTANDFTNESFASANETFLEFNTRWTPPMLLTWEFLYVWGLNTVYRIDWSWVITTHAIFNRYVVWITKQGTQFRVYTDSGEMVLWDGVSWTTLATIKLGFNPARVTSDNGIDNIVSEDWDYYISSWYTVQLVTKKRKSNRLNDNSQYIKKLDFTTNLNTGQSIIPGRWWLFMIWFDTKPGIYRREKIIEWLADWYHKVATRDNENIEFDEIFTQTYFSKWQSSVFIWYQSWTTKFWVDYMDLDSKETAKEGYAVTDVFSWWTAYEKEIEVIRFAQSYNGWEDNYIKLYKRINNGYWEEISLTKPSDDTITRENLTLVTEEWIDVQFKVELYNGLQDDTPPIFHELAHDYDIIKR